MKASDRHTEPTRRVPIGELKPYARNARLHPPAQIEALKSALQTFGLVSPLTVLASTMEVLGGNGRLLAMQALKWKEVECKVIDVSAAEASQINVALNRHGELSSWDEVALASQMLEAFAAAPIDPIAIGYTTGELDALMIKVDPASINATVTTEIDAKEIIDRDAPKKEADVDIEQVASIVKPGDRWVMGSHVLVCDGAHQLAQRPQTDTIVTSVPEDDTNATGLARELNAIAEHSFYVVNWKQLPIWTEHTRLPDALIVWDQGMKNGPGIGYDVGQHKSICYYGNTQRPDLTDLWRIPRDRMVGQHSQHLPVTLVIRALSDIAARRVVDPWAGSGSVLIAAEQLGVQCFAYETDPRWCDVIIARWQQLTGKKARKSPHAEDQKARKKAS